MDIYWINDMVRHFEAITYDMDLSKHADRR
jgi:hypothetical protein